jgi:two-component system, cell cycle sensor histidine kinase and response regulator CckA
MAAVLGIVRGHRGAIFVNSTVDQGTVIRVLFPVMNPANSQRNSAELTTPAKDVVIPFSGKVLIVDDEEGVRNVCQDYLATLGLETLCASDGEEAITLFKQHAGEIICVVLDLNMPRMDGLIAFRTMKSLCPGVQVILCSGYNEQEATQKFLGDGLAAFIQKPYRLQDLKQKLEQVLPSNVPPRPDKESLSL